MPITGIGEAAAVDPVASLVTALEAAAISSTAGGDLSGTLPSPTVAKVNGVAVSGTAQSGYVLMATGASTATWQAAVTTYTSGLSLTAGQLVMHQGITYRVTTSHTTGSLPDLTKMVAFNAVPAIFYPETYGAIGDGTVHPLSEVYGSLAAAQAVYPFATALTDTLDQCGIQSAINAAVAAGPGTVQLADKTYVVDGALHTAGNGYALLYIPALTVGGAQSANIEIRGASSGTGFGSPTGDAAGGSNATIIKTTLTGQTLGTGAKIPCVIGGPSLETAQAFTAVDLTIRNLLVQCPTNPTLAGIDLAKVERAYLDGVNVNTVNAASTLPTAIHAIGVRMPDVTNYGVSRVGSLGVFGYYAAVIANTEHFNAADLTLKYNYGGLCLTGHNGWHGSTISKMQSEWQCYHIASWQLSGLQQLPPSDPAIVNISLFDIEDAPSGAFSTVQHIIDNNNLLRGRIQYLRAVAAGSAGPTNGLLVLGATKVELVDLFMPAPSGSGGILAVNQYNPPSSVTTTSSTFADVDATNLKVTFIAPSSGNALVSLEAWATSGTSTTYGWDLRDGGGDIAGTKRDVHFGSTNGGRVRCSIYVTGLIAGTSYTWKWGHGVPFGSSSCSFSSNNSSEQAVMMVTAA